MPDEYLSIADRWMRRYEAEHPDVVRHAQARQCGYHDARQDQNGLQTTAEQSKNEGSACLLKSPQQSKAELDPVVVSAILARKELKLTQTSFARCLGISPRTLRDWEQGRRCPSGAALTLLTWVSDRPDYIRELHRLDRK